MTVEQRADEVRKLYLLLPEKEQDYLWIELLRRAHVERNKHKKLTRKEIQEKLSKLDASVKPNNVTMEEILEVCDEVRKELHDEREQSYFRH